MEACVHCHFHAPHFYSFYFCFLEDAHCPYSLLEQCRTVHKSQNLHTDWLLYLCLLFLKLLDLSASHKQNYHSYQHRLIVIQYGGHAISQPYVRLCHEQICEYLI